MSTKPLTLGDIATDTITGFKGVVIARTEWLNGCRRYKLQPKELKKDGTPKDSSTFDEQQIALSKSGNTPATYRTSSISLGDTARDTITGFEGVVTGRHDWLSGELVLSIQPKRLHEGNPIEPQSFNIEQLELVKAKLRQSETQHRPGGPFPEASHGR
jgi:hypothetical protein